MDRFPDFFGEWAFEPGSVTDLWGLVFGAVVLYVTWRIAKRQFGIMAEQDQAAKRIEAMATEQTALIRSQEATTKRMEVLTATMADLLTREGEIAETQHKIMQEQLSRRSEMRLHLRQAERRNPFLVERTTKYEVVAHNAGNKTCQQFRWTLHVELTAVDLFKFEDGLEIREPHYKGPGAEREIRGAFNQPVFPGDDALVTIIEMLKSTADEPRGSRVQWSLMSEDGRVPSDPQSFGRLDFYQDRMFRLADVDVDNLPTDG